MGRKVSWWLGIVSPEGTFLSLSYNTAAKDCFLKLVNGEEEPSRTPSHLLPATGPVPDVHGVSEIEEPSAQLSQ